MKITGVSVAQTEVGRSVSVTALFANNEDMEDADVQRILDAARELAGDGAGAPVRGRGKDADVPEDAPRRRRSSAHEEDRDNQGEAPRRRSSSRSDEDTLRRSRSDADNAEPTTRRRTGARSAEPAPADEEPQERPTSRRRSAASEDAEEQPSRSRGRGTSEGRSRGAERTEASEDEAPKRRGSEPAKIGDEELMKACSATSRVTSSRTVMKIVEQFGVGEVSKIPQAERREFLDLCKEARDKAARDKAAD